MLAHQRMRDEGRNPTHAKHPRLTTSATNGGFHGSDKVRMRPELAAHPGNTGAQQNLAIVLDTQHRPAEAIEVLKKLLAARPDLGDARYLLGKALVAEGQPAEALPHLEAAAKLSPEDPAIHYQLGQAYQRLARPQDAEREFEAFRRLKEATRK